jgi:hypothetical protein
MDEQDQQIKQWQAQHLSFPYLGVPPVSAEKVIGMRALKEAITAERLPVTKAPSQENLSFEKQLTQPPQARSGAVYLPVEISLNNTLHPIILSNTDLKRLTAVMLPSETNLQNPLLPIQPCHQYYNGIALILTGEDAYKETVAIVNKPYFLPKLTPDQYAWRAFSQEDSKQNLGWTKKAIPLDVTPLLRTPLAFADARLDWLTPQQVKEVKEQQKEVLAAQENTLKPLKAMKQPITEILNPHKTMADVVSLQEAQTAVSKELKTLPSVGEVI